ncbi:PspC domain-containing protein [Flavobacterium sp. JP2137]|uniref:PspC domain-containing protein n=1 Tax=Flavobacterium sp. JP2137 TaxID=3414510 RepID=UPI003D2FBA30
MNKTVTVNIAGIIFHIDENAYNKLSHYLQAIRNSINIDGREEIIHDIESRIAELFTERINANNQVIILADVDSIIQIMGQPEDYRIDDEDTKTYEQPQPAYAFSRKLYRDTDKRVLGGVLAGLGHYFRIDPIWLRLLLLILTIFYGTGVLVYIILWIVIPKASSTSEKLEMKGEPINISSIEKKVRENIEYVSDKVNSIDYQKVGQNTRAFGDTAAQIIRRALGIGLIIFAFFGFLGSAIAGIVISQSKWQTPAEFQSFNISIEALSVPLWLLALLVFLLTAIPFIIVFLIGLKLLYKNLKYVGLTAIILTCVWFFAILAMIFVAVQESGNNLKSIAHAVNKELSIEETFSTSKDLPIGNGPVEVIFVDERYFESEHNQVADYISTFQNDNDAVELEILTSYQDRSSLTIKLETQKKQLINTEHEVLEIPAYNYQIRENQLILSDRFITEENAQYSIEKVKLYLYLTENTSVRLADNAQPFLEDDIVLSPGIYTYKMVNQTLSCLDCK